VGRVSCPICVGRNDKASARIDALARACKRAGCAVPLPGPEGRRLTRSNRRTTAFVHLVADERRQGASGTVTIDYWVYRPTIGWERITRIAEPGEVRAGHRVRRARARNEEDEECGGDGAESHGRPVVRRGYSTGHPSGPFA
jgi:hypothetical protein